MFISIFMYSQDIIELKKGDKAPSDGIFMTNEAAEKEAKEKLALQAKVDSYEKTQIPEYENKLKIKDQIIADKDSQLSVSNIKFDTEHLLRMQYEKDLKENEITIRILSGFTIGLGSLVIGETAGIAIYYTIKFYDR